MLKKQKTKAYESGVEIVLCEVGKLEVGKCPFDISIQVIYPMFTYQYISHIWKLDSLRLRFREHTSLTSIGHYLILITYI